MISVGTVALKDVIACTDHRWCTIAPMQVILPKERIMRAQHLRVASPSGDLQVAIYARVSSDQQAERIFGCAHLTRHVECVRGG